MWAKVEIWLLGRAETMVIGLKRRGWIDRSSATKYRNLIEARLTKTTARTYEARRQASQPRLLWRFATFALHAARFALQAKVAGRSLAFVLLRVANAFDASARVLRLRLKRH